MKEITTTIFPVFVLFANFSVVFLCLPRKKSLRFTVLVFGAAVAANFIADIIIGHLGIDDPTKLFRAWTYLPFIIYLFKGLVFQKVFAYFAPMTLAGTLVIPTEMLARFIMPLGEFWYWLAMLLIPTAVLLTYVLLVRRFGRGLIERLFSYGSEKEWALYALSSVIFYIVLSSIYPTLAEHPVIVLLLLFFIDLFLIILCFAIINTHEKSRQKYETELAKEIISTGRGYYEKLTDITEQLHIMRHDYKHHLVSMQKMIKGGYNKEIENYLEILDKDYDQKQINDYCKSRVVNALLDSFSETCKNNHIEFQVQIILPPAETVDDYELCIILGNLLENAITACLRTSENERRYIDISMTPREGQYDIKIENSFDGVLKSEGKSLYTLKKDGGLGIRSIMTVARKWSGEYVPSWDNKKFSAFVALKLNKE
jgi:signal transduction histidine kinase